MSVPTPPPDVENGPIRVLVTGGAGFIGSHVAAECLSRGYEVWVIDNLSGGRKSNLPPGASFMLCDLRDNDALGKVFGFGPFDVVYHFAAYAAENLSHNIRCFNYDNNLTSSVRLLNHAIGTGTRRFVFASSAAVYGEMQGPWTERCSPVPMDPYGVAKLAFEQDLKCAHQKFGLNFAIGRLHNVYGPGQNLGDPFRNVVGIFFNACLGGRPLPVFGDGRQRRRFTYIGDITESLVDIGFSPLAENEIFNIGGSQETDIIGLAQCLGDLLGRELEVIWLEARNEAVACPVDHSKFDMAFPDCPSTPLADGLTKMFEWAKSQQVQTPALPTPEIRDGIPLAWLNHLRPNG
jgi:UDP-glucose 4-epimerase